MILTTEKQTPVSEIKSKLDTAIPLEKYGDIADFYEFNQGGSFYYDLAVVNPELITVLLANLDNDESEELKLLEGNNKFFLNIKEDLCLILIGNSSEKYIGSVEIKNPSQTQEPPSKLTVCGIGDYAIDISANSYLLSTNRGAGITTSSSFLFGDSNFLTNLNKEYKQATGLALMNLAVGKYSADINISKSDLKNEDELLLFDGLTDEPLTVINSKSQEIQKTITFDIPYGYIFLTAIDKSSTSGITEFIFSNLKKVGELNYTPPETLPLTFDEFLGAVKSSKSEAIISTGTGSRSLSTLGKQIEIPEEILNEDFVEGGFGKWNLPNGKYRLTYELKTSDKTNIDTVFVNDNGKLIYLNSSDNATIKLSASQNSTNLQIIDVLVTDGKLILLVLDRTSKSSTTELKVTKLEYLGNSQSESVEIDYLIDTTESKNLAEVNFELGGEITKRSFNLRLEEYSQLSIQLNSELIIAYLKNNQSVYSTEYAKNLIVDLSEGEYELNLFTESSTSENYQLNISAIEGFDVYIPIRSEPPNPQPETLRKLGDTKDNCFNFGILKPWESDNNSGKTWNKGYLYPSAHLGFSNVINSIVTGQPQVFSFEIDTVCYLNLMVFGTVNVAVESMNQIIGKSDGTSDIQLQLATGKYYVFIDTQFSESIDYELSLYLSNSDPNYAD